MDTAFLPEWQGIDLEFKRNKKIFIRFTEHLHDYYENVEAGGVGKTIGNEHWIRIAFKNPDDTNHKIEDLTFVLMHELTERDFKLKTKSNDTQAFVNPKDEIDYFKQGGYRNLLDEKIANRRAMRAIRRMWPNANWTNPEDEYDEDKPPSI